jgi:hypothetical protein
MPLISYPLVAWGSVENLAGAAWSAVGTPVITPGQADPFGGTGAFKIGDDAAGAVEGIQRAAAFSIVADRLVWTPCIKQGTSTSHLLQVRDVTAADYPLALVATWAAGVPAITPSATGGNPTPTVHGAVSLGNGWYVVVASCPWTSGNTAKEEFYGTNATASDTGDALYYVRSLALLDLFDEAVSWEEDREGSNYEQGPSGFEDAARVGIDHYLEGRVRFVPQTPRSDPGPVSGWYGENEAAAVNGGVKAMLRAGREKQLLRWVPNRAASTVGQDAYLVEPIREKPGLERSWDRTFMMRLRSASVFAGV